jgi:hypothetical protein
MDSARNTEGYNSEANAVIGFGYGAHVLKPACVLEACQLGSRLLLF